MEQTDRSKRGGGRRGLSERRWKNQSKSIHGVPKDMGTGRGLTVEVGGKLGGGE